ncbi:hypothetical protein SN11_02780 [Vibrio harveyi]|nr:hypothetical protein SN10_22475 [Vibrio harveyi]KIP79565.1 hypothetical protein SN11_02780 [Vibrio harveyi]
MTIHLFKNNKTLRMIVIIICAFNHNEFMGLRHAARSQFGIETKWDLEKKKESEAKVEYRRCIQKSSPIKELLFTFNSIIKH